MLKLDSSKQRDTSKTTSPETLLQELYSYAWLSWSQIPNCYQQLSRGFAVLLNHPLDSSSTPSGSISEPRLRLSSALHTTAIPPPACLDAKQKTKPTGSPCYCCRELWGNRSCCEGVVVISSLLDADSVVWAPRRALCAGLPEHTWGSFHKGCCKAQGGRAVHSQPSLTPPCLTASNHARLRQILFSPRWTFLFFPLDKTGGSCFDRNQFCWLLKWNLCAHCRQGINQSQKSQNGLGWKWP